MLNSYKKSIFTIAFTVLFIFLFNVLSISPSYAGKKEYIYKNKREVVYLKSKRIKKEADLYSHPHTITLDELKEILSQVKYKYSKFSFFDWSGPTKIFSQRQANLLATHVSDALAKAKPNDTIEFALTTPSRKIRRYTKGRIFIKDDSLNINFDRIFEPGADVSTEKYGKNFSKWQILVSQTNQSLKPKKYGKNDVHKNWILVKLDEQEQEESK